MKNLITLLIILVFSSVYSQSTYLHCGQLFDSKKAKFIGPHTIVIDGEKITSVAKGYVNPKSENDIFIDLNDAGPMSYRFIKKIVKGFKRKFLLSISGWGDADMINFYDNNKAIRP